MMAPYQTDAPYPFTVMSEGRMNHLEHWVFNVSTSAKYGPFVDTKTAWDEAHARYNAARNNTQGE